MLEDLRFANRFIQLVKGRRRPWRSEFRASKCQPHIAGYVLNRCEFLGHLPCGRGSASVEAMTAPVSGRTLRRYRSYMLGSMETLVHFIGKLVVDVASETM